jgi:hypothetical protein
MSDKAEYSLMAVDPTESIFSIEPGPDNKSRLLMEIETGKRVEAMPHCERGLSPGANLAMGQVTDEMTGVNKLTLFRRKDRTALVSFGIDVSPSLARVQFDAAGTSVAWGNADGTVSVADLKEVQRQLAHLKLGWE